MNKAIMKLTNMNKKIILLFTIISLWLPCNTVAGTTDPLPLDQEARMALVDSISGTYYDWEAVSISGKLSGPMLPVTASVKIYMEKGKLLVVSISAPLVGEAARIEIDRKQALLVNKMKSKYTTIDIVELEPLFPGGLEAIQNLILGRINILGEGELNPGNAGAVNVYATDPKDWIILPEQDLEGAPFVYLYTVDRSTLLLDRFIVMSEMQASEGSCTYSYPSKGITIDMDMNMNGNVLGATLRLNEPDSKTKEISRIDLSSKYKKTDLRGVLK